MKSCITWIICKIEPVSGTLSSIARIVLRRIRKTIGPIELLSGLNTDDEKNIWLFLKATDGCTPSLTPSAKIHKTKIINDISN